jgi:hypothetical protein
VYFNQDSGLLNLEPTTMCFAVNRQNDPGSRVYLVPRNRVAKYLASLNDSEHATIRPIADEEILCVWSVSMTGVVKLIDEFAEEDSAEAFELADETEDQEHNCLVLPKSLGPPSFPGKA